MLGLILSNMTTPKLEHTKELLNLSEEQERIFDLLAKRKSINEIAMKLNISTRTVDREIRLIKNKILELSQM